MSTRPGKPKSAATGGKDPRVKKALTATEVVRTLRLVGRLKPEETPAEGIAGMVVSGLAINVATAALFSKIFGDVDLTACLAKLQATIDRVHTGDLGEAEALLTAQAITLNTMFTHLAILAVETASVDKVDRFLRLALKAQAQCRATLETLAAKKKPPALIAQQANIAHGPQQVNNTVSADRRDSQQPTRMGQSTRTTRSRGGS